MLQAGITRNDAKLIDDLAVHPPVLLLPQSASRNEYYGIARPSKPLDRQAFDLPRRDLPPCVAPRPTTSRQIRQLGHEHPDPRNWFDKPL